jgi:predicted nuclease of predicted toxin-antitoxin system
VKLLFDQNISFRILPLIQSKYPEAAQVKGLNLVSKTDIEIWQFAKINGYTIVTFDSDFKDLATLFGHPPKIIWLRLGNSSTKNLADFFIQRDQLISQFISDLKYSDISCLEFNG